MNSGNLSVTLFIRLNNFVLLNSQYVTIDMIKQAIVILEVPQPPFLHGLSLTMTTFCKGRLTNIYDIPKHAPYLFQEPVWSSQEAQTMLSQIRREDYGASGTSKFRWHH